MPKLKVKIRNRNRVLDARPDRYDIRDRPYQPRLVNLPEVYPSEATVAALLPEYNKLVLDQGEEGACTGFGLAAMINFLRFKDVFMPKGSVAGGEMPKLPPKVSPRMLYENARLYDEWPGEDYDGSSARGAMKGWHRHGVCLETTWPYLEEGTPAKKKGAAKPKPGKPKPGWELEAAKTMLGAYYRVQIEDITDLQSAIYEVGAVYASADVHNGWDVGYNQEWLSIIDWNPAVKTDGGHAFALVGFNSEGFIVQNSWGPDWGYHGFALLTYNDWVANATDAWVAALGVPRRDVPVPRNYSTNSFNLAAGARMAAASAAEVSPGAMWAEDQARDHTLILGNEGVLLRASAAEDPQEFIQNGLMGRIQDWMAMAKGNRRLAIYAHGGLNSQEAAMKRVQHLGPWFKANGIFPIFIVWKTGWQESLADMGEDILAKLVPGGRAAAPSGALLGWLGEKLSDGWDYTVETALGFLGKSLWRQMKQNAEASGSPNHGGTLLAGAVQTLCKTEPATEIHLIGHSAGSIWMGHLLTAMGQLSGKKPTLTSCSLYAAACTVPFALEHYAPAVKRGLVPPAQFWSDMMNNKAELGDNVGGFYRRSLLYFVSRACEEKHKMPILGMEAAWSPALDKKDVFSDNFQKEVAAWRAFVAQMKVPAPQMQTPGYMVNSGQGTKKQPPSHGGFDNDITVITRTFQRILRRDGALPVPISSLEGY